ncbi:hypothetical protein GYMLUDRAFT_238912 [Collybiopsis luxurians FD-317 M1]|nr:hypothetical protein GYMLUDRAFT_238912 [Collybiopsis luxurians FD-317 M1]
MSDYLDEQSWVSDDETLSSTSISSPRYTRVPSHNEITLDAERLSASSPSWTYRTKHMSINLGRRLWGTGYPAYGLNDKIQGSIKVSGIHPEHVESITVTLEGNLVTAVVGDGGVSRSSSLFLNHTISLPLSRPVLPVIEGSTCSFSIPIPSEITLQHVTAFAPPSFYRFHLGVTGEIAYSLKISMVRQASRIPFKLEPNETKIIPILYFPKTRPSNPPLAFIPKPALDRELQFGSPDVYLSEHVSTFPLIPQWSPSSSRAKRPSVGLEPFRNSVFFSLPAPQSFASGERIPFFLSLVFPNSPVQAAMYTKNIRISLIKQLTVRPVKSSLRKLFSSARSKSSHSSTKSSSTSSAARARASPPSSPSLSPSWNSPYTSASRSAESRNTSRIGSPADDSFGDNDLVGGDETSYSSPSPSSSVPSSPDLSSSSPVNLDLDLDMYASPATTRWKLTTGVLETRSEYSEGVYLLRGWISAGELGRGCSWRVGELARLQYFLRVEMDPVDERARAQLRSPHGADFGGAKGGASALGEHLPAFVLEKEVEITTDCWETMNRELWSMGGLPTPALGLARCVVEKEGLQEAVNGWEGV